MRWMIRRRRRLVLGGVLAALAFGLPQPAAAQTGGDVAIGYSFLSNNELAANASNLPYGFFFDSSIQLNDFMSFAFDLNGHYRRGITPSDTYSGGPSDPVVKSPPDQDFQAFSISRPEDEYCSPRLSRDQYDYEDVLSTCHVNVQTVGVLGGPRFHFDTERRSSVLPRAGRGHARVAQDRVLRSHRDALGDSARRRRRHRHDREHRVPGAGGLSGHLLPRSGDLSDPGSQASLLNAGGANYKDFSISIGAVVRLGSRRN